MVITDEQIYNSLPPDLQGELKAFGALESHTGEELHDFMFAMRDKYAIPPWDAFTLLFQRAARTNGESMQLTATNSWCMFDKSEDQFTLNAHKDSTQRWCIIHMEVTNNKDQTRELTVAAIPDARRVWSYRSESFVASDRIQCSVGKRQDGVSIAVAKVLEKASEAVAQGLRCVEYVYHAHKRAPRAAAISVPAIEAASAEVEQKPEEKKHITASAQSHKQPTPEQREVMLTVFELAAAKARELGMHSTIIRWRETLSSIIGQEAKNVQECH